MCKKQHLNLSKSNRPRQLDQATSRLVDQSTRCPAGSGQTIAIETDNFKSKNQNPKQIQCPVCVRLCLCMWGCGCGCGDVRASPGLGPLRAEPAVHHGPELQYAAVKSGSLLDWRTLIFVNKKAVRQNQTRPDQTRDRKALSLRKPLKFPSRKLIMSSARGSRKWSSGAKTFIRKPRVSLSCTGLTGN